MAAKTCWRCLERLTLQPRPPLQARPLLRTPAHGVPHSANAFSTTAAVQAGKVQAANKRGRPALRLSKKKRVKTYKRPDPGERKALRKRIVLSNTNALDVPDLEQFTPEIVKSRESLGQILTLRDDTVDGLRAAEAFRTSQRWSYFRRPCTLARQNTRDLTSLMDDATRGAEKKIIRRMIVGEKGVGKSILVLQAQAWALAKGWVVINMPEARDLTSATTSYQPIPNTSPPQFAQKDATSVLLARTAKTNHALLSTLPILQKHPDLPLRSLNTLESLVQLGANDPEFAWPVFQALWSELTMKIAESDQRHRARPPILMSLDGVAWISRLSSYLAPSMAYVHAHDLVLVKHFISCLTGAETFPNGGAVLAADSHSNRPHTLALDLAIKQSKEQVAASDGKTLHDPADPWSKVDERSLVALQGVETMKVPKLDKYETRVLLEYFARSGMLRRRVTETVVGEVWTLAGQGVAGEVEKVGMGQGIM